MWGFRTGFITYGVKNGTGALYGILEEKTAGAIRGNISNAPNISQSLLLQAYGEKDYRREKDEKFRVLEKRYRHVKSILKKRKEYSEFFQPLPYNSGYFMCVKLAKSDPETIRQVLLKNYSTGIIATNGIIRIAYSSIPDKLIEELFDNIYDAVSVAPY